MKLKQNWRILVLVVIVLLSISLVATKGLRYGIDFTGGTELKLELAEGGEEVIDSVVEILKNRLNKMGLKSTQVLKEADNRHITIKVSTTNTGELADVKNIINKQAVFEQRVEGELCAKGDEIQLDISQSGGADIYGNNWRVYVKNTGDSPERCGQVMEGKDGHMTDIFLDRPDKAFILMDSDTCTQLSNTPFSNHPDDTGYTMLSFIEERALIPVVCYTTAVKPEEPEINETLLEELGVRIRENETELKTLDINQTVEEVSKLLSEGITTVILPIRLEELPQELQDTITDLNLTVAEYVKSPQQEFHINYGANSPRPDNSESWIDVVTGLKSTLRIGAGLTYGNPVYSSVFEGGAPNSEQAREIAERFKIWLTSGNLPIKISIILERPNLPELGQQFLNYVGIIAVIAIILVASVVSIRYRKPKISLAIILTSFSEIILILGFASISSWELDLAAIAGIIAAIGTGVDHQIIITDETLRGERRRSDDKLWDIKKAINRAFFIIFTSAATTISAMLPLMSIVDLRGFAFTSIVGVLIGISITRPAYARIVEFIT